MLFPTPKAFRGLPADGFGVFELEHREARRRAIVETFHPPLSELAADLLPELSARSLSPLHAYLPRLDWPRGYQPFCTWLALSRMHHGYQEGPQLNVGVHRDHVAIRLGWDTAADRFGRFEFLCRHAGLGPELATIARDHGLAFRLYSSAPWPAGARRVVESADDWRSPLDEARRHGNWLEIGERLELPASIDRVASAELGEEVLRVFRVLLPVYDRVA